MGRRATLGCKGHLDLLNGSASWGRLSSPSSRLDFPSPSWLHSQGDFTTPLGAPNETMGLSVRILSDRPLGGWRFHPSTMSSGLSQYKHESNIFSPRPFLFHSPLRTATTQLKSIHLPSRMGASFRGRTRTPPDQALLGYRILTSDGGTFVQRRVGPGSNTIPSSGAR